MHFPVLKCSVLHRLPVTGQTEALSPKNRNKFLASIRKCLFMKKSSEFSTSSSVSRSGISMEVAILDAIAQDDLSSKGTPNVPIASGGTKT